MSILKSTRKLAMGPLLAVAAFAASAEDVKLPDGNDWSIGTERDHLIYILGMSNTLSAGYVYDEKHFPGQKETFSHRAVAGLNGTTVEQAVTVIDAWYKAHPTQLDTPIFKVLWDQIGKPRIAKSHK